jgi:hypothetical protein
MARYSREVVESKCFDFLSTFTYNTYSNKNSAIYTGRVSESGDFAKMFLLVRQYWGGCRHHHFAANFHKSSASYI